MMHSQMVQSADQWYILDVVSYDRSLCSHLDKRKYQRRAWRKKGVEEQKIGWRGMVSILGWLF